MDDRWGSLVAVTQKKQALLSDLLDLLGEQTNILQAEDLVALGLNLEQIDRLTGQIDCLDQQAAELKAPLVGDCRDTIIGTALGAATASIRRSLEQAMAIDRNNAELRNQLLERYRDQLAEMPKALDASRAYLKGASADLPSYYANRKV